MLYITDQIVENPTDYRIKLMENKGKFGGCIDRMPCVKCGRMHVDTICLCVGTFSCLNCGHQNGLIPTGITKGWTFTKMDDKKWNNIYRDEK